MALSNATSGFGTLLQRGDSGAGAGVIASKTVGTGDSTIVFKAKTAGTAGNTLSAGIVIAGLTTPLSVSIVGNALTVNSETDGSGAALSTVNDVIAAIYANSSAAMKFDADNGAGDGTGLVTASAVSVLAGGTAGAEIFTTIAEVTSLTGPDESSTDIDVTHMESPGGYRETISALKDGGSLNLSLNFLPADANQQGLRTDLAAGTRRNYRIIWSNIAATTYQFAGRVTSFSVSASLDDKLSATATIKITGDITTL